MAKSRFLIRVEYILARMILGLLRLVPRRQASRFGAVFGSLVRRLAPGQRRIVRRNLRIAYGDILEKKEAFRIEREAFRNLGRTVFEFMTFPRLDQDAIRAMGEVEGLEHVDRALAKGRGLILVTGHIGNWEMLAAAFSAAGRPLAVIVRPLDNPLLDRHVESFREGKGMRVIPRGASLREGLRALKKGSVLAFVMDQNSALHGEFVPFFGTDAATVTGPARLALRTDAPVILCYTRRLAPGRHRFVFTEEIPRAQGENEEESIRLNTARFTEAIEAVIRECPEQWLWMHPRWRTRPEGDADLYQPKL